ncbi:MAG TPA: hypothetical protein VHE78_05800, partial [Gemmatimonadaceae bacterium]|nr:hypothetical protein [Gemmatimonadaceae bacterium]
FPRLWLDHAARGWLTWLDPATLMSLEGYALVLYADLCVRLMHSPATEQLTPDLVLAESEWAALLNEHDHGLVPAETKARRRAAVRALQTLERRGLIHPGAAIDRRSGHLRVRPTLLLSSLPVLTGLTAPAARRDRILFAHLRRLGFDTDRATRLLELSAERVHQALLYVAWRTLRDGQVTHVRQQREPIESPAKYVETAVRDAWEFGEPEFKRWLQSATSARHHVPQTQVLSLPTQAAGPDAFASDAVALDTLIAAPGRPVDEVPEHATLRAALTAELGTAGPHLVPWVETARVGLLTPSMLLFVAPCSATGHPVLLGEADFLLLDSIVIRIAGVRLAPSTQFRAIARDGTLG